MRRLLLFGALLGLSACQFLIDGGRPNIIPLPEQPDRLGDRPNTADDRGEREKYGPPWSGLNLPYGDAEMVSNEGGQLVLTYDSNKLEGTTTSYDSYFLVGGYRRMGAYDEGNIRARRYEKEGAQMGLLVEYTPEPPAVKVTVEDFNGLSQAGNPSQVMSYFTE